MKSSDTDTITSVVVVAAVDGGAGGITGALSLTDADMPASAVGSKALANDRKAKLVTMFVWPVNSMDSVPAHPRNNN